MVVVGLASLGINRFLAQTQEQVLAESIAIIERTERVAQDADFAASLAGQLAAARGAEQLDEISRALEGRVDRIADDLATMQAFLGQAEGRGSAQMVRDVAGQMNQTVARKIAAEAAVRTEAAAVTGAGTRLAALISTEVDLARLRVTAGIWELYALPGGEDPKAGLDRLADVDFFAYERLGDIAEAVSTLSRLVDHIAQAQTMAELDALTAGYRAALDLARDRTRFMLSARSVRAATAELHQISLGLTERGVLARRKAAILAQTELDTLSAQLGRQLDLLIEDARLGRDETRARMQQGVATAGRQSTLLSATLAGVVLLALLAGYLVWARTRQRVVLRLEEVAGRIVAVAKGDLGQPTAISGADEIGRLEGALNILRERVDEAARLRGRLEAAVIDRTAEVVAEMQLANAARADAEEQSRAKTHFLARMSHEIRTPLNGLIGLLDLLAADEADAARRARLEVALTSARDLQELTEDILTFSVSADGQDKARLAVFDPAALARGLAAHLEVIAPAKGLVPEVQIDAGLPPALIGEPTKIRQVMMNLLSNAVKYTERGKVGLAVSARPAAQGRYDLALAVRDTGPGMTAEETQRAFDIYGRSRSARQSGVRGVGLGLAIVRQLTDAMGAELRISTAPGSGSSFTLVLRLPEAAAADLPAVQTLPAQRAGGRVLVVDDHAVNRLVARGYLERMGCRVTEAATGKAALAAAQDGTFDAILVDLGLPDIGGEEVLARMARKGAKVAVLTADLVRDDAETRRRFGVERILTKPISPRALAALVTNAAPGAEAGPPAASALEAVLREDMEALGPAQTAEIVTALLADLATAVAQITAAATTEARRKLAHRLKGAASNFRLQAFCTLMQRLQTDDLAALAALDDLERVTAEAIHDLTHAARNAGLALQGSAEQTKQ